MKESFVTVYVFTPNFILTFTCIYSEHKHAISSLEDIENLQVDRISKNCFQDNGHKKFWITTVAPRLDKHVVCYML